MDRAPTSEALRTNDGYVYRSRVREQDVGQSVIAYHVARFPHADAAAWRRSIDDGRVCVNGRATSPDVVLRANDLIEFHRPPWVEPEAPTEFGVVYEDEHVLAVDKPSGLQVLPAGPFSARTLLNLVRASHPSRADCSPVHRLGRGTSGITLFGRTPEARASFSRQFRQCTPRKTYLGLVVGVGLPDSCIARHAIGPVPHGQLVIHVAATDGKPSITRLRVVARDLAAGRSLVAAQPITGRPDQIRIHVAALGAPLVGDPLFGVGGVAISDATPGQGGYFLHATGLRFVHPLTQRWMKLRSKPPWL